MIAIKNGKIITPEGIVEGKILLLSQDRIFGFADTLAHTDAVDRVVNAHGRYIMPGLIDAHSDKIEQYIQPRPTSQIDFEFALKVCERDLLSAGITTMYHSLSLFKDDLLGNCLLKTKDSVQRIADLISDIHKRNHLIRHRLHLRIEIDHVGAFDIVREMLDQGKAHLLSFMDHTPGQGQYNNLTVYYETVSKHNGRKLSELGFEGVLEHHKSKDTLSFAQMKELTAYAHARGIAVASHDDDTLKKLGINREIGVDISEFPISIETARSAKAQGFYTVVGAPNILRGSSHAGNLSAAEAVVNECADILCSDYYPPAILFSIFHMHQKQGLPLHKMVNMATLNPAKATRIDSEYGSIEIGKKADLLIVDLLDGYPVITHVFVDGIASSRIEYRR